MFFAEMKATKLLEYWKMQNFVSDLCFILVLGNIWNITTAV